jgi:hypothetical protein
MTTEFTSASNKPPPRPAEKTTNPALLQENLSYEIVEQINFEMTGYLIKVLDFKCELVKLMKSINDAVDRKENVSPKGTELGANKDLFQWVAGVATRLDALVQQTLVRFRLRGVSEASRPCPI